MTRRDQILAAKARLPLNGVRPGNATVRNGTRSQARSAPCRFLGEPTGETVQCPTCSGKVELKVFPCSVYGKATVAKRAEGVPGCCKGCTSYVTSQPITTRHLLYHVYPYAPSPTPWRLGIEQLRERWRLFTGRKIVAVVTGADLEPVAAVKERFPSDAEVFAVPNVPHLREVATWAPLWDRVLSSAGSNDAILYCHSKGATRPFEPGNSCHWWASLMYSLCLDHWPAVDSLLSSNPICGPFKKIGRGFRRSASKWHYSGTFFWVRAGDFQHRPWRAIDKLWYGTEAWPGTAYTVAEAGELFMTGPVPTLDVYEPKFWESHIRPQYAQWLKVNPFRHREVKA